MSKASEYRDTSVDELEIKLDTLQKEIYELRSERLDGKTQKTHLIREGRKNIARIKTILREKVKA